MNSITDDQRVPEPGSWKWTLIIGLWAVVMALVGWIATDATTGREAMKKELAADTQEIAVMKEREGNIIESQNRIEQSLQEVRRQLDDLRARRK